MVSLNAIRRVLLPYLLTSVKLLFRVGVFCPVH